MQAVTSRWLNLEKTIFNQKTEVYTAWMITCDVSKLCLWGRRWKVQVLVNREKGKERTRLCSIICEFSVYFYTLVIDEQILAKVGVPYNWYALSVEPNDEIHSWCFHHQICWIAFDLCLLLSHVKFLKLIWTSPHFCFQPLQLNLKILHLLCDYQSLCVI